MAEGPSDVGPRDGREKTGARPRSATLAESKRANERGNELFRASEFKVATEAYSKGIDIFAPLWEESDDGDNDAAVSDLRRKLLCNRAASLLRMDEPRKALRDADAAIEIRQDDPKAWRRGGLSRLHLKQYFGAKTMLVKASSLNQASGGGSLDPLIEVCDHLIQNAERLSQLRENREDHDRISAFFAKACDGLVDDDPEEDGEDHDFSLILASILRQVTLEPQTKLVLSTHQRVWSALMLHLSSDSYADQVALVLKEVISGECAVTWPPLVLERLLSTVLSAESDASDCERDKRRAVDLIEHAASTLLGFSWLLLRPRADLAGVVGTRTEPAVVPLSALLSCLGTREARAALPVACAQSMTRILGRYCASPHGPGLLAEAQVKPIAELSRLFRSPNDLMGAFAELSDSSIPSHFDRVTTAEEAQSFFQREKKRMYNAQVVGLRHAILDALNCAVRRRECLTAEAFVRQASMVGKPELRPTQVIPNLLQIVRDLHAAAPLTSTPILGADGAAKSYEKRPFAADFNRNPFGDAFVDEEDKESRGETLLSKAIDVLIGSCEVKNAAITLCSKNIGSLLSDLSTYATDSIVIKTMEVYKRLFLCCQPFVSEVMGAKADMVAYSALVLTKVPKLQCLGMNKSLLVLSTCSGNDFAWFCRKGSALDACYTLLCRCVAESQDLSYKEYMKRKQATTSAHQHEVIELSRQIYLRCLERCRLQTKSTVSVPKDGAWDSFGRNEILEMERYLIGKPPISSDRVAEVSPLRGPVGKETKKISSLTVASKKQKDQGKEEQDSHKLRKGFFGAKKTYKRSSRGKASMREKAAAAKDGKSLPENPKESPASHTEEALIERIPNPGLTEEEEEEAWMQESGDGMDAKAEVEEEIEEDDLRVVWDSTPSGDIKRHRTVWANLDPREKLSWTQTTTEVTAIVRVPQGTQAKDVHVVVTPTRLLVKLHWYGRVFDGPLSRRCKASESWWILDNGEIEICIPKDDNHFWRSLFEGGQMKSYYEVLREMVRADEATPAYEDLTDEAKDLVDELRERQELAAEGLIDPDVFDDFRCVLSDGDNAK